MMRAIIIMITRRRPESAYMRQVLKTGLSAHRHIHTHRQADKSEKKYIRQFHSVHLANIIIIYYGLFIVLRELRYFERVVSTVSSPIQLCKYGPSCSTLLDDHWTRGRYLLSGLWRCGWYNERSFSDRPDQPAIQRRFVK